MNGGEISLKATVTAQVSDQHEVDTKAIRTKSTGLVTRIGAAFGHLCKEANGLELLVDEAKDRASKPWYQRIPED